MKKLVNKSGVALMTVVLFFLVLVILLGGLQFISINNLKNTQTAQKHTAVYYVAESGINLQVAKFMDLFDEAIDNKWTIASLNYELNQLINEINTVDNSITLENNFNNSSSAEISITGPHSDLAYPDFVFYTIQSDGTVGDSHRTLTTNLGFHYKIGKGVILPISGAIIVNSGIDVQHGTVDGAIASNLSNNSSIVFNSKELRCDLIDLVSIPSGETSPCPNPKILTKPIIFSEVELPDFPPTSDLQQVSVDSNKITLPDLNSYPGKDGFYIANINPTGDFVFDLGNWGGDDENKILRVTGNISFNKKITITGKGNLLLMINHSSTIDISGSLNANSTDPTKLLMVLDSNQTNQGLTISNGNTVVASILMDSTANISWNKAYFNGFLITNAGYPGYNGLVSISAGSNIGGAAPIWVYAPHATVDIQAANTTFYGTVMANAVTMNANKGGIIYAGDTMDYPFSEWTLLPGFEDGNPAKTELEYRITPIKEN